MSERLLNLLDDSRHAARPLLACAVVVGDPYLEATVEHMSVLAERGVDIIELIFPFSDPAYHGTVIQRACQRALREGVSAEDLASQCEAFRESFDTPVIVSSYLNRLLAAGLEEVAALFAGAGVDGVLVTDLPWEEAAEVREIFERHGLLYVPSIAPTTTRQRAAAIASECAGGLAVWTGHVGGDLADEDAVLARLDHLQVGIEELSIIASMKISTPEDAARASAHSHGILVGSALIWLIEGRGADLAERLGAFVQSLRSALDG